MRDLAIRLGVDQLACALIALSASLACSSSGHAAPATGGGQQVGAAGDAEEASAAGSDAVGAGGAHANGGASSGAGASGSSTAGRAGMGGSATTEPEGPLVPERIASVNSVFDLVVKDGYVYFSDDDDEPSPAKGHGHVSKVRVTGGAATILAHSNPDTDVLGIFPTALAVDGANVYWADGGLSARLLKTPIDGGATVELWKEESCTLWGSVALDAGNLYTLERCAQTGATLLRVPTAGGSPTTVGSGTGGAWTPGALGDNANYRGLSVGDGLAYWSNPGGSVVSFPLEGGEKATLVASAFDVSGPSSVALSGDRLFFIQNDFMLQKRGAVWSVTLGMPGATKIADKQNIEVDTALAVDEASVYWAVDDAILSAPRAGGTAVTVAASLANPRSLAVDGSCVYWTEKSGGIWRVRKQP